jgi:hypothetical protein
MLFSPALLADDANQINSKVRRQVCSVDDCTITVSKEKPYGNYKLIAYDVGGAGTGSATALVLMRNQDMALLKVFNGFGANGEVTQANIRKIDGWAYLEIYEMTSKGNGSIELYSLDGEKYSLVFQARGVDWHDDDSYYENGILTALYPDINHDGHFDIVLEGTVLTTDDKTDKVTARNECRRVFIWNSSSKKFEETKEGEINQNLCADR